MSKKLHILMIAFGTALLLHAGQTTAYAGFIAATLDVSTDDRAELRQDSACAGAACETPELDPLELLRRQLGFVFSLGNPASPSGMASTSVDSSSGPSTPATFVAPTSASQTQLVAWLGPEGKVWLPPPFLSGVFRPPRFAS